MYDSDVISPVGQACCSYHRAVALPLYRVLTLGMGLPSADTLPEAGPARAYQDDDEDSRTLRSDSYVAQEWYVCMHLRGGWDEGTFRHPAFQWTAADPPHLRGTHGDDFLVGACCAITGHLSRSLKDAATRKTN